MKVNYEGNPWGLSEGQAIALEAMCIAENRAEAIKLSGFSKPQFERRLMQVNSILSCDNFGRAMLLWDRWQRAS